MLIVNKRGTVRNIEPTQLGEYERKGYKQVAESKPVSDTKTTKK